MALLQISRRDKVGSRHSRRLRQQGLVPAVIYGHGEATMSVAIPRPEIERAIQHGERLLKGNLEGGEQNFLVKDVQYDHMGVVILHVDLTRVRLDEKVKVSVPIVLRGTPVGVQTEDGVLSQNLKQLEVECLVMAIPEDIRVPVAGMHVNDVLRVANLTLPEGVRALNDPETVVAAVSVVKEEVVAPAAAVAAEGEVATTEPEVIGAKPEEGEEAEAPEKPEKPEKAEKPKKEKE